MSKPIIQELRDARLALDRAIEALEGTPDASRPVDWAKSNIEWQAIARRTVETEARRVKERYGPKLDGDRVTPMYDHPAPTWHTKGYAEAMDRAREAHFAILRRNGIDAPIADCNDRKVETRPLTDEEIDGVARWAAKRELERGKPPADDPRPRSETIVVADKYITPLRDDPGAGVFFKRRWWWPF